MSDLTKFSDGASILQQVDVSDIFKNLAMGIAEAQQKLDDNSIAQAIKLAQTQINGVSLLELGFAPVFYAFQYADISASINLKMALKEELEFGFGLDLEISNKKGYSEEDHEFLSEDSFSESTTEYKASRQMNFRANEKNAVKINGKFVQQSETLEAKSRLQQFKDDIEKDAEIEQVYVDVQSNKLSYNHSNGIDVWVDNGFLRVEEGLHYKKSTVGILRIKDYTIDKSIDVNGASGAPTPFTLNTDLLTSLAAADDVVPTPIAGKLYGITADGDFYTYDSGSSTWKMIPSTIYFPYNSDEISYTKNLKNGPNDTSETTNPAGIVDNHNHADHALIHKALRLIQSKDPDAKITITGVTDPKGGTNPKNESLAKRRAESLRAHIFGSTAPVNVATDAVTNTAGPSKLSKRYAKIKLSSDYMIFIDGDLTVAATPDKASSSVNKFVYTAASTTEDPFYNLDAKFGSAIFSYKENEVFSAVLNHVKGKIESHSYEQKEGHHYFLEDKSIVKFNLLTNKSEEISIESVNENSSEGTEDSETFFSGKTKNEKSLLNDSTSKKSQDNSFALGASVDFRMSRQFEMSMEGNASMSARLVSVPAPQGFVVFLQNVFVNTPTE